MCLRWAWDTYLCWKEVDDLSLGPRLLPRQEEVRLFQDLQVHTCAGR